MASTTKMLAVTTQLLLAAATAAAVFPPVVYSDFYNPAAPQFYYVSPVPMVATPIVDPSRASQTLPCPSQGFFPHPTDCSRFYRCVDYVGTGQYFSPYEFQCPAGQRFVAVGKNTCVPGDCTDGGAGGQAPPTGPQSDAYPSDPFDTIHIPPGNDPNAAIGPVGGGSAPPPASGGVYPQPGQAGTPGDASGGIPPSPVQVDVIQPATGGGGAYPQPGAGDGSGGPGAGVGGVYPQPGAGEGVGAGTGSGAEGAYPQPGVGAGTGTGGGTAPGSGAEGAYPQPGVGTGSESGGSAAGSGTDSGPEAGAGTGPGSSTAPETGGAYPQPGAGGGTSSSGGPEQPGAGEGYPGAQPGGACPARYVQHSEFCNVYEPCPSEGVQYICVTLNGQELVFDQARQMCGFPSDKEDVCKGKPMMPSLFRTDISLFDSPTTLQQLSVPVFIQGQGAPSLYQAPAIPYVYQQQQSFPSFSQQSTFPIFYHV